MAKKPDHEKEEKEKAKALAEIAGTLRGLLGSVVGSARSPAGAAVGAVGAVSPAAGLALKTGVAAAESPVGTAAGLAAAIPGSAIQGLAAVFADLQKTIESAVAPFKSFVEAIAPSAVLGFNQAIAGVSATIGSAFVGALNVFSSVAREVGGVLLPLMQQLTPIINALANSLGTTLVAVVRVVVAAFGAVAPALDVIATAANDFARLLSDVLGIVTAAVKTFGTAMLGILGANPDGYKDVFKGIVDATRSVIKALITLAAQIGTFFGFGAQVRKLGEAIDKEAQDRQQRKSGLQAAASSPQITDIAALVRQAQLASFTAAGGGAAREKPEVEFLRQIADALRGAEQEKTFEKALSNWWNVIKNVPPLREALAGMAGVIGALEFVFRTAIPRRP